MSDRSDRSGAQPIWIENLTLVLGRAFAMVSLILVIIWATRESITDGYLGGLDWNKNVFNWHPVMMIAGIVCCTGWSITAFRMKVQKYSTSRNLHVFFHLGAKICITVGLRAAWEAKDNDENPHFVTLHSWLGIATSILLFQNDILGLCHFVLPYASGAMRKLYAPYHIFFGKMSLVFAVITIEAGIMEKNTFIGCQPEINSRDKNPGGHYEDIPPGCRLSDGLGITVALALIFLLFALRNKKIHTPTTSQQKGNTITKQKGESPSFFGTVMGPLGVTTDTASNVWDAEAHNSSSSMSSRNSSFSISNFRARASSVT
mmetsp:Transcript_16722/g.25117  ORF Transcript_16722/g.25117 Transcript_16722/m.25117 type:complete len:317 (-) Transcript_16722:169-1119(-)|eukprot:CAMPEP_0185038282 /NCGR_PEP_ID=MMETSP1103-20130426/33731_1 /TAXON_ID=36769 /ORGANISM="Paraphysomonas bandaiensis, Strain Caron Lab Isolate" /LENGTH=316 /DNA_ID=CAMNT_0027576641 /DNA_START=61 /DNA_END=1011 /DNA_ORIENTATION=+